MNVNGTLFTSKGSSILPRQTLHFERVSIGLHTSLDFYYIIEAANVANVTGVSASLVGSDNIRLYEIVGDEITNHISMSYASREISVGSLYEAYKIGVIFSPKIEESSDAILTITVGISGGDDVSFVIHLHGYGEDMDDNLMVLLQNNKEFITNDMIVGFYESSPYEVEVDHVLMNQKRREFLIELFNLKGGFMGSYKSLTNMLKFFGYGDLLTIREIWKSLYADVYKHTDILNSVVKDVDLTKEGFSKTDQMVLVYQINEEDGTFDDDGLENYVNVLLDTDKILVKMHAIQRVLRKGFLPLNVEIVDIMGEYTANVGIDNLASVTPARYEHHDLTIVTEDFAYSLVAEEILIKTHRVTVDSFLVDDSSLDTVPVYLAGVDRDLLDYFNIVNVLEDGEDDLDIGNLYVNQFGLVEFSLVNVPININRYQYEVLDSSGVVLFTSEIITKTVDSFSIRIGIQSVGEFSVQIYLYDGYGSYIVIGGERINISNQPMDFSLYNLSGVELMNTEILSMGVTSDVFANPVLDARIWELEDINTIDYGLYPNDIVRYHSDTLPESEDTYLTINDMKGISIEKLTGTPLAHYGYVYGTWLIDLIGDGSVGTRRISYKLFNGHDDNYIEMTIGSAIVPDNLLDNHWEGNDTVINDFINTIHASGNSIYENFSFFVEYYDSDNGEGAKPMLRIITNNVGVTSTLYIMNTNMMIVDVDDRPTYYPTMPSQILFFSGNTMLDNLFVDVDGESFTSELQITSVNDLVTVLESFTYTDGSPVLDVFDIGNDRVRVSSQMGTEKLTLSHINFGISKDVGRGLELGTVNRLPFGDDVKLCEPLFAFVNREIKINEYDVVWRLTDTLTGELVSEQVTQSFRINILAVGSYTLSLTATDKYGTVTRTREGCFLIK